MSDKRDDSSLVTVVLVLNGITVGGSATALDIQFENSTGLTWALPDHEAINMTSTAGIDGFKMTSKLISVTVTAGATLAGNLTFYFDPGAQTSVGIQVNTNLFGTDTGPAPSVTYTLPDGTTTTTDLDQTGLATLDLTK